MTSIKTYSELQTIESFLERYRYLKLSGKVGVETFGCDRYLNQILYTSKEWRKVRNDVIIRDNGCDLGHPDRPIPKGRKILIHHINPITVEMILNRDPMIFDMENLVSTMKTTHDAIHFGDEKLLESFKPIERKPYDTCPWRK